jgi:hypothetical protein
MEEKGRQNWEAEFSTEMNWRRKRGTTTTNEFASLAGQFGRLALDRVIGNSKSRERCDPDLVQFFIGIDFRTAHFIT